MMNACKRSSSTLMKWQPQGNKSCVGLEVLMPPMGTKIGNSQSIFDSILGTQNFVLDLIEIYRWYKYQPLNWPSKNTKILLYRMFRCCCQTHRDSDGRITGGGCTKNLKPIAVASENHQNTFTLFHVCWAYCDSNLTMQWSLLKVVGVISRNVKEVHLCGLAYTLIPKKMIIGYSHVWTPMGSVTIYLFILKSCNLLWWFVVLEWLELCMCCPCCEDSTWLVGTCVVNKGLASNPLCYLVILRVPLGKSVVYVAPVPHTCCPPLPGGSVSQQLSACSCFRSEHGYSDVHICQQVHNQEIKIEAKIHEYYEFVHSCFSTLLTQNSLFQKTI